MINILHISDVHFPSEGLILTERELRMGTIELLKSIKDEDIFFLISGDITFKGNADGYTEATAFFKEVIKQSDGKIKSENILLCPGNHDIVRETGFELFDRFSYSIRNDNKFFYSNQTCVIYESNDTIFLGINSSYNLDRTYGFVNIQHIQDALQHIDIRNYKRKIAFTHHHLINQFERDTSSIRNASQLILLLDHYGFETIFHGHQHNNSNLILGKSQMYCFGVSTPGFEMQGFTNGLNYYKINDEGLTLHKYIYSRDHVINGRVGGFNQVASVQYPRKR